ncbi:polyphosphate:AMP phosphotransferase [Humisphaera borealis]|uniref:Polyphosphate:AMP phosphotransferase n=1 Tax=Humisphaera borealis TaxID=2807512 RepID=A0A7M2WS97_9BACT|nr:polyphosphate:AMP phosphotransferase [Humisphaera borealis]QOV87470.1 polyphosphate:AMP phosphotransferase [Humisphaera borealis]
MFEAAEIGNSIDKKVYKTEAPKTRGALLDMQRRMNERGLAVCVLIGGVEGAGKSETLNVLLEWMDPRGIQTHALRDPTDEERDRPYMWRFWRLLPPKGRMGIFLGTWYAQPMMDMFQGKPRADVDLMLDRAIEFERMLHAEHTLVIKIWLHLSKDAQDARLRELEQDSERRWRVTEADRLYRKHYDRIREIAEHTLRRTGSGESPWHIVEGADARYRQLTVAQIVLKRVNERLTQLAREASRPAPKPDRPKPAKINLLNRLDLSESLKRADYEKKLNRQQGRIAKLTRRLHRHGRSMALVFEGPDAAGKGGAIRRLIHAIDARDYQVVSISKPTDEERAHPYLWRFWRYVPGHGRMTIFDRSWYGRVLVERIEGFCRPEEWKRAYSEINEFEQQLFDSGCIVQKFYLNISPDEQLSRFKARQQTPYKQYKINDEDWRNREKWDAYEAAACEMIERTSSESAPWVLVEANDKLWARIKVLKAVADRLEESL